MISANMFMLANLVLYGLVLLGLVLFDRRDRRWTYRWHRNVRTRRLSTDEAMRLIVKAQKRSRTKSR